jgi:Na+/phosphate symporter
MKNRIRISLYVFALSGAFLSVNALKKTDTPETPNLKKKDTIEHLQEKFQLDIPKVKEIKKAIKQMLKISDEQIEKIKDNDLLVLIIEYCINLSTIQTYVASYNQFCQNNLKNQINIDQVKKELESLNTNISQTFEVFYESIYFEKIKLYVNLKIENKNSDLLVKSALLFIEKFQEIFKI